MKESKMKTLKILLITIITTFFFSACATKVQDDVLSSNKTEISKLLTQVIEKEKEILHLKEKVEDCEDSK